MERFNWNTYSTQQLFAIAKLRNLAPNTTFFASELGLNSGEINSLKAHGYIAPTGRKIEGFIHTYGDNYKKVEIKEWKVNEINGWRADKLVDSLSQLAEIYNMFIE